ncbi:MAG: Crp/Fnr family transcriptional regulator [Armatimonadota bacterium]|nr:Crp/Fnr family transcriptional regulator [Armatimonadota bacterium]
MKPATLEVGSRVALLKRNAFFRGLDDGTLEGIAPKFFQREYKRRDYVWFQGDPSDAFVVIRDGYVKIVKHSKGGKDVLLEVLGPGDVLGAVALLEGRPYPATACALSKASLLLLSRDEFLGVIERNPAVVTQALVAVGSRLRYAHEMMRQFATECVESRVASLLLILGSRAFDEHGERVVLDVRLTRRDIADMVGAALETTIRLLSRWEKNGVVSRDRGHIVLLDLPTLRKISSEESYPKEYDPSHIASDTRR